MHDYGILPKTDDMHRYLRVASSLSIKEFDLVTNKEPFVLAHFNVPR